MSQADVDNSSELDADDRAWLDARLEEYRDLLVYLHDH